MILRHNPIAVLVRDDNNILYFNTLFLLEGIHILKINFKMLLMRIIETIN
jgi:hypothetical protein